MTNILDNEPESSGQEGELNTSPGAIELVQKQSSGRLVTETTKAGAARVAKFTKANLDNVVRVYGPATTMQPEHLMYACLVYEGVEEIAALREIYGRKGTKKELGIEASTLARRGDVRELIAALVRESMRTEGVTIAYETLREIMLDQTATGASRIKAAEMVLSMADEKTTQDKGPGKNGKTISEMTLDELQDLVSKLEQSAQIVPKTIDITPSNPVQSTG